MEKDSLFVFSCRPFWPPLSLGRQLCGKAQLPLLLPVHPLALLPHHLYLRLRHHPRHSEWVTLTAHAVSHSTLWLSGVHRDLHFSLHAFSIITLILIFCHCSLSALKSVYSRVHWHSAIHMELKSNKIFDFFTPTHWIWNETVIKLCLWFICIVYILDMVYIPPYRY